MSVRRLLSLVAAAALAACGAPPEPPVAATAARSPDVDVARAAAAGAAAARRHAAQSGMTTAVTGGAVAAEPAPQKPTQLDADGYADVEWTDLMPRDELDALREGPAIDHSGGKAMTQSGSFRTIAAYSGRKVRLPGYVVPVAFDDRQRMSEFLFVPYFGACIHVPPPPPNQLVHVRLAQPVPAPAMWDPQWLRGVLATERVDGDIASAAYAMSGATLAPYE